MPAAIMLYSPCPDLTLTTSIASRGLRPVCVDRVLPLDARLVAQRQDDGADHGDQQHARRRAWNRKT